MAKVWAWVRKYGTTVLPATSTLWWQTPLEGKNANGHAMMMMVEENERLVGGCSVNGAYTASALAWTA